MRVALMVCAMLGTASIGLAAEDPLADLQRDYEQLQAKTRAERDRLNEACDAHVRLIMAELERRKGTGAELAVRGDVLEKLRGLHARCLSRRQALAARFAAQREALAKRTQMAAVAGGGP